MLKSLSIPQSQLSIPQRLLQICKKSAITHDGKPEIDFLLLDRQMQQLQQIQTKTCQQIVEFVDEHLEEFIDINRRFNLIQQNVESTEMLIKKLIPKLDMYRTSLFAPESKIQEFMTAYEKKLMQQKLSQAAKEQAEFLLDFIHNFQNLINVNIEKLINKHKYNIVRLLKKKQYIRSIFEHPFIKTVCHNSNDLSIMLSNVTQQLQFYISEQLSRVSTEKHLRTNKKDEDGLTSLEEMQIWYQYMGKEQAFFESVEQSIIGRQLSALELTLIAHKQSLIVGNEEHILKQFFLDLFSLVQQFPVEYPTERILKIIYKFLGKKQLNFLYSYVVPTFPISYSAYKAALQKIENKSLRAQLEARHGWNLKLWADLRIKTIMDRSSKDKDKSLLKWIDIVFKKSFMIDGVRNHMIKLAFMLVNRFCFKIEEQMEYNAKNFNQNINVLVNINQLLRNKLLECFDEQLNGENIDELKQKKIRQQINVVINNIHTSIDASLKKWLKINLQTVINTCKSSLQPYKSLIASIISKKDRQKISFNTQDNILKPLRAYFKNNPELSEPSCKYASELTLQTLQKYYDSEYAKQIYNHCDTSISKQQMKLVMEVVAIERQTLFQREKSINQ